ncbi:asparaginase [bacterium]|nr:asparaginase [bacterium]
MDINAKKKIVLMTTGGTIDKSYDEFDGTLANRDSLIKTHILDKLRFPYLEIEQISILSKDSLHFTEYDRILLAKSIEAQSSKGHPVVVLHGTDSMAKSAQFIKDYLGELAVPIIFTGAMKPVGYSDSDAYQNVVSALMSSQTVSAGIYISFHLRLYQIPGVRKNPSIKSFEAF